MTPHLYAAKVVFTQRKKTNLKKVILFKHTAQVVDIIAIWIESGIKYKRDLAFGSLGTKTRGSLYWTLMIFCGSKAPLKYQKASLGFSQTVVSWNIVRYRFKGLVREVGTLYACLWGFFGIQCIQYLRCSPSITMMSWWSSDVSGEVGRSWRYCNARPTRDEAGASSWTSSPCKNQFNIEGGTWPPYQILSW